MRVHGPLERQTNTGDRQSDREHRDHVEAGERERSDGSVRPLSPLPAEVSTLTTGSSYWSAVGPLVPWTC